MGLFDGDYVSGEFTEFSLNPGVESGRIGTSKTFATLKTEPTFLHSLIEPNVDAYGVQRPVGNLFCLGHDTPGRPGFFRTDDFVRISQIINITNETVIQFFTRLRPPRIDVPTGYIWRADLLIANSKVGSRKFPKQLLENDDSITYFTWFANVSKLSGALRVSFVLSLIQE